MKEPPGPASRSGRARIIASRMMRQVMALITMVSKLIASIQSMTTSYAGGAIWLHVSGAILASAGFFTVR
jgi:hypothetical protein